MFLIVRKILFKKILKKLDKSFKRWYNTKAVRENLLAHLGVAQLGARYLGVVEAASSSLVTQIKIGNRFGSRFFALFGIFILPIDLSIRL